MRIVSPTTRFRKDLKRELRGAYRNDIAELLDDVISSLINDQPLALKYRDHALVGTWSDHRDCHLKPDLVLIYRKPDSDTLQLVRLGSHSELEL